MESRDDPITVLHVDDDPQLLGLAETLLEDEGNRIEVETAQSAAAALERLEAGGVDCVVSDYEMPGMDGLDLLAAVRDGYPDMPFVLFTGKGSEELASEAISAGVTDYLQKERGPDQYAVLANRVENLVESARTERALAERKRRLETLISNLPGVVYRCRNEPGWPMEFVEGECRELTGYRAGRVESGAVSWGEDVIHPDDRADTWTAVQRALEADEPFEVTYRIVTADGTTRWMWERGRGIDDREGDLTALEGFITDVTARKERDLELERYETIVEASGDPVYTLDDDGRFTFLNDALRSMTGYEEGELVGEHISRLLTPADLQRGRELVSSLVAGDDERQTIEVDVLTADGHRIPCETNVAVLPFGEEFRGTVGVVRDVSERVERERVLKRLQRHTESLIDTATVEETAEIAADAAHEVLGAELSGFHVLSDDGDRLEPLAVVDTVRDEFGTPPTYHRDADDPPSRAVWDAFEGGDPLVIDDTREYGDLSSATPARSSVVYPLDDRGVFIVSSTEPGRFDERDRALLEILVSALKTALDRAERETLLRERERELERQNERLDEFASIVSHDLRNPLNVAAGRTEMLADEFDSEQFAAIERAHDRMEALIDDLLGLARAGQSQLDVEPVHLGETVRACWQHVETPGASVVVDADGVVLADESRLQQLLENCFRNAIEHGRPDADGPPGDEHGADVPPEDDGADPGTSDASTPHGGSVDASTPDGAPSEPSVVITVGACEDGFYVADDGPGIPPAQREDVFEAGFSTDRDGTGFGLSIVQQIADTHGWTVTATESESGGACFEFTGVELAERAAEG